MSLEVVLALIFAKAIFPDIEEPTIKATVKGNSLMRLILYFFSSKACPSWRLRDLMK
jgi:hypothetical protein